MENIFIDKERLDNSTPTDLALIANQYFKETPNGTIENFINKYTDGIFVTKDTYFKKVRKKYEMNKKTKQYEVRIGITLGASELSKTFESIKNNFKFKDLIKEAETEEEASEIIEKNTITRIGKYKSKVYIDLQEKIDDFQKLDMEQKYSFLVTTNAPVLTMTKSIVACNIPDSLINELKLLLDDPYFEGLNRSNLISFAINELLEKYYRKYY